MSWTAIMKNGDKIMGEYVIMSAIASRLNELKAIQFDAYGVPCIMTYPGGLFNCGKLFFMIGESELTGPVRLICNRIEQVQLVYGVPQPRECCGARIGIEGRNELGQTEKRVVTIYANGAVSIDRQVIADKKERG